MKKREFLRICGSVVAGGSIFAVSGFSLWKMSQAGKGSFSLKDTTIPKKMSGDEFISPYRLMYSFDTEGHIEAFEMDESHLFVVTPNAITIYDMAGTLLNNFPVASQVRDIKVADNQLYILYPGRIEVYSVEGEFLRDWDACSELSDYCSFTIVAEHVYVTDTSLKNICQYTTEGGFVRFIQSPNGFIIPSYTFGIECIQGVLYCSNSGRHLIESYTLDGEYIGSFGKPGGTPGLFAGCCNPVHLSSTPGGELITSEKGRPRISCFSRDGHFHGVLLDTRLLGGSKTAYEVKPADDKLYVAGNGKVAVFRYDPSQTENTACAGCVVSCPLRKGVSL